MAIRIRSILQGVHKPIVLGTIVAAAMLYTASTMAAPSGNLVQPGETLRFTHQLKTTTMGTYTWGKDTSETESSYAYEVTTAANGYKVKGTQTRVVITSNGMPIDSPFFTVTIGTPMTIALDTDARAIGAQGVDNALSVFKGRVGEQVYREQYEPFLQADKLTAEVIDEWNTLVPLTPVPEPKVGKTMSLPGSLNLPDGAAFPATVQVKATAVGTYGPRQGIALEGKARIATPSLLAAYDSFYARVGTKVLSASADLEHRLVIDAKTGILLESREKRITRLRVSVDGGKPVDSTEESTTERRTVFE